MRRVSWFWPAVIVLSAAGAGLGMLLDVNSPLRVAVSFWFLLVCPGMAYVRLLRLRDRLIEFTLAIALSLALDTIVTECMLYAGTLWTYGALSVLGSLSVGGAVLQVLTSLGAESGG
jgi:hypothetical protein